jgi:hypothetical protein
MFRNEINLKLTFEMSTNTLAAGLSTPTDRKIVAPSLVTSTLPSFLPSHNNILSIPFGPKVLLTSSPIAMAPMNDESLAVSAFSSSASPFNIVTGFKDLD